MQGDHSKCQIHFSNSQQRIAHKKIMIFLSTKEKLSLSSMSPASVDSPRSTRDLKSFIKNLKMIFMLKRISLFAFLNVAMLGFSQQYNIPAVSPRQAVEQQFSVTKISIEYGRPAVKGRKILIFCPY